MDFGQRLKNLRLERGYTQQDLSSAVGVSTVAVRSWEHNTKKPNMDALIALGRFLNTSIDTLLDIQPKGNKTTLLYSLPQRNASYRTIVSLIPTAKKS